MLCFFLSLKNGSYSSNWVLEKKKKTQVILFHWFHGRRETKGAVQFHSSLALVDIIMIQTCPQTMVLARLVFVDLRSNVLSCSSWEDQALSHELSLDVSHTMRKGWVWEERVGWKHPAHLWDLALGRGNKLATRLKSGGPVSNSPALGRPTQRYFHVLDAKFCICKHNVFPFSCWDWSCYCSAIVCQDKCKQGEVNFAETSLPHRESLGAWAQLSGRKMPPRSLMHCGV